MLTDTTSKKELIMHWIHATHTMILQSFVELVDSQINFNKNGIINAVPIIGYHDIDNKITITIQLLQSYCFQYEQYGTGFEHHNFMNCTYAYPGEETTVAYVRVTQLA